MASSPSSFLIDADLHGLVDGRLDADRRADALRRLASSPADRVRVEAWQSQNELLRSAFGGVDREPLPVMLDLSTKPRLQCIAANDSPLVGHVPRGADPSARPVNPRRGYGLLAALLLMIAAAAGTAWMVFGPGDPDDIVAATIKPRASVDATLASRAADAIDRPSAAPLSATLRDGDRLPTTEIPDLRGAGFSFVSAEIEATDPASIMFRYQNGAAERLAIAVAYATPQDVDPAAPVRIGNAYGWHKRDHAFSLAGTLRPGRLRAIALAALQNDDPRN